MDLLVPVQSHENMKEMILDGINEFYCGFLPIEWIDKYGKKHGKLFSTIQISLNRRDSISSNVKDEIELKKMTKLATENNAKLFLTLNAPFFPQEAYEILHFFLENIIELGIIRVIVSDIGLIKYIYSNFPSLLITISCDNQVINSYAVDFYKQFKPERIVLPRHITIKEAESILINNTDIEFEYFILSNKCVYDDGNCRCMHDLGAICLDVWKEQCISLNDANSVDVENVKKANREFSDWAFNFDVQAKCDMYFWKEYGCSICSLYNMTKYPNMVSLKIVGRGKWIYYKDIFFIQEALNLSENGATLKDLQILAKKTYGYVDMCETTKYCMMRGE